MSQFQEVDELQINQVLFFSWPLPKRYLCFNASIFFHTFLVCINQEHSLINPIHLSSFSNQFFNILPLLPHSFIILLWSLNYQKMRLQDPLHLLFLLLVISMVNDFSWNYSSDQTLPLHPSVQLYKQLYFYFVYLM